MKATRKNKEAPSRKPEDRPVIEAKASPRFRLQLVSWLVPVLIVLITFAVFLPALDNGFVTWDDELTISKNLSYRGLGWSQLRWMFTTFHNSLYRPLTWMTLSVDYLLWGMNPSGYHLSSIVLHCANALLFYFIALRLLCLAMPVEAASELPLRMAAGYSALIFSLHPLRVEPVAWLSARNDLVSALFLLLAILLYLRATEATRVGQYRWGRMTGAVGAYGLSLLAKATGMTLPFVLLTLDICPLKRLTGSPGGWFRSEARRIWWEKVPFFLFAVVAGIIALRAKQEYGAVLPLSGNWNLVNGLMMSFYGVTFYLWKTIVPLHLRPLYERPGDFNPWDSPYLLSGVIVLAASACLVLARRRCPTGLVCWVCYVVLLLPVLGIVSFGQQLAADRYSYLPCLGWAVLAGAGVLHLSQCWVSGKISRQIFIGVMALSLGVLSGFGVLTWKQNKVWHDSVTLFRFALSISERSIWGHTNLGQALYAQGRFGEAAAEFQRSLQMRSDDAGSWYNVGRALARQGNLAGSVMHLETALKLDPRFALAEYELGNIRASQGKLDDAEAHFRAALRIEPNSAQPHNNLGSLLAAQGKLDEATVHFREAIRIDPNHLAARRNLGSLLAQRGKLAEAVEQFRAALKLNPGQSDIHFRLAGILIHQGNLDEGIRHFEAALKIRPDFAEAHEGLGRVLASRGKTDEAVQHYNEALRILKSRSKSSVPQ